MSHRESGKISIWEFNESFIRFIDYKMDIQIQWFVFKNYKIIDNILFLTRTTEHDVALMLSMDDIGKEDFNKVIELVKQKIIIK